MKKYKAEFRRQKSKGKKWGEADKIAMKHAALPYKTKSKTKEAISPQKKLRQKIVKAQKRYEPKPKPKVKPKPKSLLQKTRERIKKLFAKKEYKPHTTARTTSAEKRLKKAGISKKQIAKLRDKKK